MPLKVAHKIITSRFQHPFTISKATKTEQPALVVSLSFMGHTGYGEAPAISYYGITAEQMQTDLLHKLKWVEGFAFSSPERYWHYLHHLFPQNPFLVCALDIAAWDLYGKMKRKPLRAFWSDIDKPTPITDYTIGIDEQGKMIEKLKAKPWPSYKIKVGYDGDVDCVAALRQHTTMPFRVDANGGWSVDEALQKIETLHSLGVELIEQPLPKDDWEGMGLLRSISQIPLVADETCVNEADVAKCAGYFDAINIKLTKCSGITPALRMIAEAKKLDLKIMLGCMNETSIGTAALHHLSPLVDYLDADGPLLLAEDTATGLFFEDGKITCAGSAGLGIETMIILNE